MALGAQTVCPGSAACQPAADALRVRLQRELSALESHPDAGGRPVRAALLVYDLGRRELLFCARPDLGMAPASNMKLLTTAAALDLLGPEFRFVTRAWAGGPVVDGVLRGDLRLQAGGDPSWCDLVPEHAPERVIESLAGALAAAGIRSIRGRLLVDAALFDRVGVHPDWPAGQLQARHCAPVGGLAMARSCVRVVVTAPDEPQRPVQVRLEPPGSGLAVLARARTVASAAEARPLVGRQGAETLVVDGRFLKGTTTSAEVAVADPVLFAARVLAAGLQPHGLSPGAGIEVAQAPFAPVDGEPPLWEFATPLDTVVRVVNKESQNLMAEHLLKTLGRARTGEGSFEAGARVLGRWLEDHEIPVEGIVVRDGSGLSASNRLSARAVALILTLAWRAPWAATFLDSLPLAGVDGSLKDRPAVDPALGAVRAKTGWIRGASALSGFLLAGERSFCFAILVDYPPALGGFNRRCKAAQDRILAALAGWAREGHP